MNLISTINKVIPYFGDFSTTLYILIDNFREFTENLLSIRQITDAEEALEDSRTVWCNFRTYYETIRDKCGFLAIKTPCLMPRTLMNDKIKFIRDNSPRLSKSKNRIYSDHER